MSLYGYARARRLARPPYSAAAKFMAGISWGGVAVVRHLSGLGCLRPLPGASRIYRRARSLGCACYLAVKPLPSIKHPEGSRMPMAGPASQQAAHAAMSRRGSTRRPKFKSFGTSADGGSRSVCRPSLLWIANGWFGDFTTCTLASRLRASWIEAASEGGQGSRQGSRNPWRDAGFPQV